jgi:hypothetical protein
MLRRVALVRTDVSEELSASFIRVTRIGELGTILAVTSNRRTLRRNFFNIYISSQRRFLQEPHGVTSQKTPFFIVTAVKTSNLTQLVGWLVGWLVDLLFADSQHKGRDRFAPDVSHKLSTSKHVNRSQ